MSNRLMTYFQFDHLPAGPIRESSASCAELATKFDESLPESDEMGWLEGENERMDLRPVRA